MDFPIWVPAGLLAIGFGLYFALRVAGRKFDPPAKR